MTAVRKIPPNGFSAFFFAMAWKAALKKRNAYCAFLLVHRKRFYKYLLAQLLKLVFTMKQLIKLSVLFMMALSACSVDPQKAGERWRLDIENIFPDPADRKGIYLAFPIADGLTVELVYFADEVSEATLGSRMARYCSRFQSGASIHKRGFESTRPDSNGNVRPVKQIYYSCVTS